MISATHFLWTMQSNTLSDVLKKIDTLRVSIQGGHQYFECDEHTIMMSLGEYEDSWWEQHDD